MTEQKEKGKGLGILMEVDEGYHKKQIYWSHSSCYCHTGEKYTSPELESEAV